MAYSSWSVVFGEQPSAAKWNILGTNDAYFDSLIGSGTAWSAWTPTLSGQFTNGDWTKTCQFAQLGNIVLFSICLVAADATPMAGGSGEATFSLPVTAVAVPGADVVLTGSGRYLDAATTVHEGTIERTSTTVARFRVNNASGTYTIPSVITSTVPFTWTTSDTITGFGFYEAA